MVDYAAGASGAASGAMAGSAGGPVGTAVGAAVGGAAGLWGGGRKKKAKKRSTFDKRQKQIHEDQYGSYYGQGPFADLYNYDPEQANKVFDETVANPAYRDFGEKVIPKVTGQFRQGNIMDSSYTGDALSKAGRDVQERLNAQRSQYMYGLQKEARDAKRSSMENYQNRTTFDYDTSARGSAGIDWKSLIDQYGKFVKSGDSPFATGM